MTQLPEPPFSAAELPGLCDRVASLDPDLQPIIDQYGYPQFRTRPNTFESFVGFAREMVNGDLDLPAEGHRQLDR